MLGHGQGAIVVSEPLFTLAVIADTHMRAPDGDLSSPYSVNAKANDRAAVAVDLIHAQNPVLTIHLGDMVHALPHMEEYDAACEEAQRILSGLHPTLHFVPGNHDIGDKPLEASPANVVTQQTAARYSDHFGAQWHHVDHGDCRFVMINASIVNSGLPAEEEQLAWLEKIVQTEQRVFLFTHYPPFIDTPDEDEHYDNYGEPGRSRVIEIARKHKIEAVLSGHVHQFFFNRVEDTKYYCLPSTSFVRQDYSELYNVAPDTDFGRNDLGKFGVTLIDVYEDGHKLRFLPTGGAESTAVVDLSLRKPAAKTELTPFMRHAWYQSRDLPYTGAKEEFGRKRARNDYPLLRLWQMGIETVRTPLVDLAHAESRRRVQDFASTGIRFHMFTTSMPSAAVLQLIADNAHVLSALEIVQVDEDLTRVKAIAKAFLKVTDVPIYVSRPGSSADEVIVGRMFSHNVWTGYRYANRAEVLDALADTALPLRPIFAVAWRADWVGKISGMQAEFAKRGIQGAAAVQLMTGNPETANFDEEYIEEGVLELMRNRDAFPLVSLMLDTFETFDRGFNPRAGLIDRVGNLTAAGRALTKL